MSVNKIWLKIPLIPLSGLAVLIVLDLVLRIAVPLRFRPDQDAPLFGSKTYRLSDNTNLIYEQLPNSSVIVDGIDYGINAYGFRDNPFRLAKSRGKRVVCVGDSLTYGWQVALKDTYHKQLEQLLKSENRDVEVIGMGVVGYNAVQEYHLIKDKVLRLNPDLVVLQLGPNDFERTVGIKTVRETGKFVLIPYHDVTIPYVIPKTKITELLMRHSHLFKLLNMALYGFATKRDKGYRPGAMHFLGEERSFQFLAKIIELLDRNRIPLAVIIFPFQNHEEAYLHAALTQRILDQLERRRVPGLNLYELLNSGSASGFFLDGLHLTEKGNALVARKLKAFVVPFLYRPDRRP